MEIALKWVDYCCLYMFQVILNGKEVAGLHLLHDVHWPASAIGETALMCELNFTISHHIYINFVKQYLSNGRNVQY